MKKFYLFTKTLLVATVLLVGASSAWAATETYDFSNYVATENLGYSTGRDLTLTGDNIATADASTVKLVSGVSSGTSFDFGGRFAVQSTTVKFRNGNSQSKATTYKVNKGIQYASSSGTNHFSILNLRENDVVIITTGYGTTKFASTNAKVGGSQVTLNQRVGSDATTGDVGSKTVCTITADGNLDLIMEGWAVIMSVTINNDTYEVTSTSAVTDGTIVDDVYGITMTYHGTWTLGSNTYAGSGSVATASTKNNSWADPQTGDYITFTPTVTGELKVKAAYFKQQRIILYKENGNEHSQVRYSSGNSSSGTEPESFGILNAGHTYYLYKNEGTYDFSIKSFVYIPHPEVYNVESSDVIKGGTSITSVPGITMTYGGSSEEIWTVNTAYSIPYAEHGGNSTVVNNIPTDKTFMIFQPNVNGKLMVKNIVYPGKGSKVSNIKLSDGNNVEIKVHDNDGNGAKNDEFSTILAAGNTYYVYYSGGNYNTIFCGFSFNPIPVTATVTLGTNGFTTFASPYPLDLTSATQTANEFTAYRAASIDGTTVTFKDDVNQNVVANTGVLLKGTANATVTIPVVASGTALAGNSFHVNTSDATFPAEDGCTYYGMIKDSDPLTFGTFNPASVAIPANKAYLVVNGGALAARQIEANFGDEILTGISEAKSEVEFAKEGKFVVDGKLLIFKKGMKFNANGARIK